MSRELAEAMDVDSISEEKREEFKNLVDTDVQPEISKEEFEERLKAIRNGEYVPRRVDSWEELWDSFM